MIAHSDNEPKALPVVAKRKKQQLEPTSKGKLERSKEDAADIVGAGEHALNRPLTRAQRAVLEVMSDPELYQATEQEKIKAAGISKRRYYEIKAQPEFKQMQQDFVRQMLRERIGPVIKASLETASKAGRDGTMERSILFQMAELHTPKRQVEQHTTSQVAIGIVGVDLGGV